MIKDLPMRAGLLLLASLLLGACTNMVRSETPWFAVADSEGAPVLRDGLWAAESSECPFDTALPLSHWPACAEARVVRDNEELTPRDGGSHWSAAAIVLSPGVPRIHQSACGAPRRLTPEADSPATAQPDATDRLIYCYAGLRADRLDAEGRIVAFTTWPIWCGPMPQEVEGGTQSNVTDAPFPGLAIVGDYCTADSVTALRAAAIASETLYPQDGTATALGYVRYRWVRDGWP